MELKGFITNLGKYNEGELVGEWVTFPIDEEEQDEIIKRIGCDSAEYEEYFFTDYECEASLDLGEYESIRHLNEIADALNSWSNEEAAAAVLEVFGVDALLNTSEYDYLFDSNVKDEYDLGYYWAEESGAYDLRKLGSLANYIDYEAFGRDISYEADGAFSSYGWIERA